jgi:hypothetical protein
MGRLPLNDIVSVLFVDMISQYFAYSFRAVQGVGLRSLDCWDCGFEYRWRQGCSSLVFVVCCVGSGLCDGLITRSVEFYCVCVCVCVSNCV